VPEKGFVGHLGPVWDHLKLLNIQRLMASSFLFFLMALYLHHSLSSNTSAMSLMKTTHQQSFHQSIADVLLLKE